MDHRASRQPRVSVLLSAHDAGETLTRAIESVLNQEAGDLELVIADCASRDRTSHCIERFADRDFRVEQVTVDSTDISVGLNAALARARGSYVMFLEQDVWLSPAYVGALGDAADSVDAEIAYAPHTCPDGSDDDAASENGPLSERTYGTTDAFRSAAADLAARGLLLNLAGALIPTKRARELGPIASGAYGRDAFMRRCVEGASRVAVISGALYHAEAMETGPFDPELYGRCEKRHELLRDLFRAWGFHEGDAAMMTLHRRHLREVIRCIGNAALGSGRVSSIERYQRVQDMIDAKETMASIEAVRGSSREFGLMFGPIARRSAMACCMGARLQELLDRILTPFSPEAARCAR